MKNIKAFLATVKYNREALIESGKLVFSIIGVGTVLADFSTMRYWFMMPGLLIFSAVWFALYLQMDGVSN